jgi:hypothetical protein
MRAIEKGGRLKSKQKGERAKRSRKQGKHTELYRIFRWGKKKKKYLREFIGRNDSVLCSVLPCSGALFLCSVSVGFPKLTECFFYYE